MEGNTASKNNITMKTKYGAVAVLPFVIIGGAYIAFTYMNSSWRRNKGKTRVHKRSVSLAALHGGKQALQRLIDYQEARADSYTLNTAIPELNALFEHPNVDFLQLQRVVARLEMSGNEDEALQILEKQKKKDLSEGKNHEAYEIEMLIVESLIYKGEFDKANSCKCLIDDSISDARRPLFKAIITAAIDSTRYEEKGRQCWEEFISMREDFEDPPSFKESIQECLEGSSACKTFDDFKKFVSRFKNDIIRTQAKKKKKKKSTTTKK